ncbi:short-chain dehydrogenase [Salipaludibacillus neizhouensis]|uniref:Short-chain dehydrogenase n=1 Tax=Salipaludibacillus neizhouensis TaxID=885475 RepID=A0A3A9KR46_9BACI|nr:SDR family oxidoreductase [Salipaludibacillus neizhouensis]RKL67146.1 short-chain dehydrogenase [Salipaludibacillus neizhouensis]
MKKKLAIITGANTGMGLATSIELAKKGIQVVMVCRNPEKGRKALSTAIEQSGSNYISLMICDLGSLKSVRSFAQLFRETFDYLDILINNAGVVSLKKQLTEDGFELQLGVNHLGHFLLTNELLDMIKESPDGRIIVLSSGAHKWGKFDLNDPYFTNEKYNVIKGYGRSKLANILFTKELASQLKDTNVTVNAVHPGAVATSLGVDRKTDFGKTVHKLLKPFFQTPAEGARTAIYLATSPEIKGITGEYFEHKKKISVSETAQDKTLATAFWKWSENEVGFH